MRKTVKLLVVDDHSEQFEHIRDFAEMYHSDYRLECRLATSGDEALGLVSSWRPSVVLLDLHLTLSPGLNLVQCLADGGAAVVATSESLIPELAHTAEVYGAVGYVPKTDNPDDLESMMDYVASFSQPVAGAH